MSEVSQMSAALKPHGKLNQYLYRCEAGHTFNYYSTGAAARFRQCADSSCMKQSELVQELQIPAVKCEVEIQEPLQIKKIDAGDAVI